MIYYLINKYGIRDPEKEFYQEATIALWNAANTYDDSRGKFSSYAYFLIEKALLGLIRKNSRQTERENAYVTSTSTELNHVTTSMELSFDPYLLRGIEQRLSANEMKWFTMHVLQDRPLKEIAHMENVTVGAVKSWAKRAKPKIQRVLNK